MSKLLFEILFNIFELNLESEGEFKVKKSMSCYYILSILLMFISIRKTAGKETKTEVIVLLLFIANKFKIKCNSYHLLLLSFNPFLKNFNLKKGVAICLQITITMSPNNKLKMFSF